MSKNELCTGICKEGGRPHIGLDYKACKDHNFAILFWLGDLPSTSGFE
jgi:hypothetical protein